MMMQQSDNVRIWKRTMSADASNLQVEPKAKISISYSRRDLAFVDRLEAALKARGFEPLIDRAEIYAFEDWWKRIEGLIAKADTIIFTLSPDAIASEICTKEVAYAVSLKNVLRRSSADVLTTTPFPNRSGA